MLECLQIDSLRKKELLHCLRQESYCASSTGNSEVGLSTSCSTYYRKKILRGAG